MRLAVVLLAIAMTGCHLRLVSEPFITAHCPPLTPLAGASFGDTTVKLIEVAGQYHECRCAALPDACR